MTSFVIGSPLPDSSLGVVRTGPHPHPRLQETYGDIIFRCSSAKHIPGSKASGDILEDEIVIRILSGCSNPRVRTLPKGASHGPREAREAENTAFPTCMKVRRGNGRCCHLVKGTRSVDSISLKPKHSRPSPTLGVDDTLASQGLPKAPKETDTHSWGQEVPCRHKLCPSCHPLAVPGVGSGPKQMLEQHKLSPWLQEGGSSRSYAHPGKGTRGPGTSRGHSPS